MHELDIFVFDILYSSYVVVGSKSKKVIHNWNHFQNCICRSEDSNEENKMMWKVRNKFIINEKVIAKLKRKIKCICRMKKPNYWEKNLKNVEDLYNHH